MENTSPNTPPNQKRSANPRIPNPTGAIVFIICFLIGCLFLYWAVEYYVYNNFDSKRYTISKIQMGNNDSLSLWKLDNRTGDLQYCAESAEKMDLLVCVRAVTIDGREYKVPVETKPEHKAETNVEPTVESKPDAAPQSPAQPPLEKDTKLPGKPTNRLKKG